MKRITCETCGSNDIIKQEGYYICQSCLTKYTPEEAKKLLVEGTVKIDNTDRVVKWLELGRRAVDGDDYLSAEKYYTLVLEEVPDNWEAFFFSLYSRAYKCTIGEIGMTADLIANNLDTVFSLLMNQDGDPRLSATIVALRVSTLTVMLFQAGRSHYNDHISVEGVESEYISWIISISNLTHKLGNLIELHFPQENELLEFAVNMWKLGNNYSNKRQIDRQAIIHYTKKIQNYDPEYNSPEQPMPLKPPDPPRTPSTCYIATSIYGSYDCPQVWILRRFRDEKLSATCFGKAFIKTYYFLSPSLVKHFGQTN